MTIAQLQKKYNERIKKSGYQKRRKNITVPKAKPKQDPAIAYYYDKRRDNYIKSRQGLGKKEGEMRNLTYKIKKRK